MPEGVGPADARPATADVANFVHGTTFAALPRDVVVQAVRCLLDLIGVAAAGSTTRLSALARAYAIAELRGGAYESRLLFDGRRASSAGAAFAGATTIDAVDAHDGHVLTKGHAGVAVLPALLALCDRRATGAGGTANTPADTNAPGAAVALPRDRREFRAAPDSAASPLDGREFLAALVVGYEIATRAGLALHASVTDYHCSGAWNALGCAAVGARLLRLDASRTREALGIAEYFGPRGQILRACSHPSMVKDGSGWGAHTGLAAAWLARDGFTGAPASTVEDDARHELWADLGARWRIREQYFKPYPVCRWAQPAVEAVLVLQRAHRFDASDVARVTIASFREAVDLGSGRATPRTTEDAQYSLPYAVAAALAFGRVGGAEIEPAALADARVRRLLGVLAVEEDAEFSRAFPAERWARATILLADGRTLRSEPARARGNPENPLSDEALREKYFELATPVLGRARAGQIEASAAALAHGGPMGPLLDALLESAGKD
jgi:2-methylcitrate dehydratase PrpD